MNVVIPREDGTAKVSWHVGVGAHCTCPLDTFVVVILGVFNVCSGYGDY